MKLILVLVATCVFSQTAFAEGLECRQVADPTPHLSCVEKPATAEVPPAQRPDSWGPAEGAARRDVGSSRANDGVTPKTTRICRDC
jgi:hypothetical protein